MKWYTENGNDMALVMAAELRLAAMTTSVLLTVPPFSEAASSLLLLLIQGPSQFTSEQAIRGLGGEKLLHFCLFLMLSMCLRHEPFSLIFLLL